MTTPEQPKQKVTLWVVTRSGEIIPELTGKTERQAYVNLGRWLVPLDIAPEGGTLRDIGWQAVQDSNPFRVQRIEIEL